MSKLNEIQQRLSEIDATRFHKLVDAYLNKKYLYPIHSTGTKTGEDKPRKGTPDTLITFNKREYIFVEYTTQKTKVKDKFLDDISKCLDVDKTGILIQKVKKIILACNSSLQSNDIETLKQSCGDIECEVLTNSILSYNLVNHYPAVVKDFLGIDIGNVLTSSILKDKYLNDDNFSTIKLLINSTPKPIEHIFINLAIIKEKKAEKNKENFINREALLSSYEEIQKPKEPIEIKDLIQKSSKSLIYGKAGIGKTTLCKYIAYMWAKGKLYEEFEYVIYLPLRKWSSTRLKEEIRKYYTSQYPEDIILDVENNDKILFLFDGYDELKADKKQEFQTAVKDSKLIHYIITSRPYGYQRNDFSVDEHFETIGFTDENVDSYIDNFFKKDDKKSQSLKKYLQSNISIKHIAYIPLMLEMICSLWVKEEFTDSLTMTELYSKVIEDTLNKYSASKDDERVFKRKNRKQIKAYLGKIAFEGLIKQKILFDGDLIEDAVEDIDFFEENVIYSGFLKSDVKEKDLLDNHFEFSHLTFQEYFAALYVSKLSKKKQRKIIQKYKFYPHMQMFFAFLGGETKDKEFLLNEIENEPIDLIGVYEFKLIALCVKEMKYEELKRERRKKIFGQVFNELKILLKYFLEKRASNLISISHIIDDDFMNVFIERSKNEKVEVGVIAKELINHNKLKFVNFLMQYVAKKELDNSFREVLFYALTTNSQIINVFNQEDVISIFLDEDDNSNIYKDLIHFLIGIGEENLKNLRSNYNIVDAFIQKFEVIKKINYLMSKLINFLAVNSKNNKEVEEIFLLTIQKDINNKPLIMKITNAFTLMKMNDKSKMIAALIGIVNNPKEENQFKAGIAISLLKLEDDVSEFFESLVELINDEKIYTIIRAKLASNLLYRGLNEEKFKELFLQMINAEDVKDHFKVVYHRTLIIPKLGATRYSVDLKTLVYKDDKKIIDIYIYILNHLNIEDTIKKNIVRFLFNSPNIIDKNLIDTFFKIIENQQVHHVPREYITQLLVALATYEPSIFDTFDKLIMNNTKAKIYIAQYLPYCRNRCIKCVQILVILLKDKTITEEYREKIFKALIISSKSHNISVENKKYIEESLEVLNQINDKFIDKMFLVEEKLKEQERFKLEQKRTSLLEIDNTPKAPLYIGGKPIYAPKFGENEIVTKEAILIKIEESRKHSIVRNTLTLKFLNSIGEKYINFLVEIIYDESVEFNKRDILIVLSNFLNKNEELRKEFIKIYIHDKPTNMGNMIIGTGVREVILNAFISINEIDFFLDILNKNEYTIFNFRNIIHYLLSFNEEKIEDKLIEIAEKNTNFYMDFQEYMNISLLFKAYDKELDILEQIKKRFTQKAIPLYLSKGNKAELNYLTTIENGKKIFTKKVIDASILKYLPKIKQQYFETKKQVKPSNNRPLVITEGKTDWKHLKKALERFQSYEFNLYENLDVKFETFENISMSDSELDNYAQSHAKKINPQKLICIFDRDLPKRVEEYGQSDFVHVVNKQLMNTIKDKCKKEYREKSKTYLEIEKKLNSSQYEEIDAQLRGILTGKEYKEWETQLNNNVYAFCIPKLNDELDEICIEFYYKEKDLKKENSEGKRLFTADEFEFREKANNCNSFVSKCGKFKTDTQSGNSKNREVTLQYPNKKGRGHVYRIEDKECIPSNNMNLSKNDFAKNIINEVEGFDNFDIENFKLIFDVIEKIIEDV
ncbi:MAG: Unknown protein [uncultured Sulfurovum sp.]|uniref:NACHT domain-containing protein n=1 Tax=uncultured Sulfurovum sp. TaxID=269237 RepID=A0A6S6STB6_9BACT|nr:MAG: Unknown protein [uncultured Sulfurovum sp.]